MFEEEEAGGGDGWLVSYADLMTLLFAAFVVLYGITPKGESDNTLGVVSRIREAFVEIPDDIDTDERPGPITEGKTVFKYFKGDQMRPPVIKKYRRNENVQNIINKDFKQIKDLIDLKIKPMLPAVASPNDISVRQDDDSLRLHLAGSLLYGGGDYRLSQESLPMVDTLAGLLKSLGHGIHIEGHTDSLPLSGSMTNWELSSLRAGYFGRYLMKNHNFQKKTMSMAGYADVKPVGPNDTPEGRSLNRRVEIKINYD